jgi:hypothetical protein
MVDLSKAMDNHTYRFDGVFGEASTNAQIFECALKPMVRYLCSARGSHGTCFAYGQTGSGKTVTMEGLGKSDRASSDNALGLNAYVAHEIFGHVHDEAARGTQLAVRAGFCEIYRGKCFDLLNRKKRVEVMEDERGFQCLVGLTWVDLTSAEALLQLLARCERTTRATAQNEQSSRSHAILQIEVSEPAAQSWQEGDERFKLSLVDLAGSEWAAKAQSDDRGNRLDGAEINKSLLCLKECIRALGANGAHVPFRGSKLTQVLKDSFVGSNSRTVMIANVSPAQSCCEHSLNTLRYAQRVKEWSAPAAAPPAAAPPPAMAPPPATAPPATAPPAGASRAAAAPPHSRLGSGRRPPQSSWDGAAAPPPPAPVGGSSGAANDDDEEEDEPEGGEQPLFSPEQRAAEGEHRLEAEDLSRSLRWSAEQLKAERAAKMLRASEEALKKAERAAKMLRASEETLVAAHAAVAEQTSAMVPNESRLLADAAVAADTDSYVHGVRELIRQRREQLDAIEAAMLSYERSCAAEDEARQLVKGSVNMPWG